MRRDSIADLAEAKKVVNPHLAPRWWPGMREDRVEFEELALRLNYVEQQILLMETHYHPEDPTLRRAQWWASRAWRLLFESRSFQLAADQADKCRQHAEDLLTQRQSQPTTIPPVFRLLMQHQAIGESGDPARPYVWRLKVAQFRSIEPYVTSEARNLRALCELFYGPSGPMNYVSVKNHPPHNLPKTLEHALRHLTEGNL